MLHISTTAEICNICVLSVFCIIPGDSYSSLFCVFDLNKLAVVNIRIKDRP